MMDDTGRSRLLPDEVSGSVLLRTGALALALLLLIAAGTPKSDGMPVKHGSRILVADVQCPDGDADTGLRLKQILNLALDQSGHFRIYPESALRESMEWLERDARTPVTAGLALQVCGREGISVFLLPRLSRAGSSFILAVDLAEVRNNRISREVSVDAVRAANEAGLLLAAEDTAKQIRRLLGENRSSPAMSGRLFSPILGNSSEALSSFAMASVLAVQKDSAGEKLRLEQAVSLEPNFALARMHLASLYIQEGLLQPALEQIAAANECSEDLPPKVKRRIRAAWYSIRQDFAGALKEYEALAAIYPEDPQTRSDMAEVALQKCDYPRAIADFQEALRLDDAGLEPYLGLSKAEMFNRNPLAARRAWERALIRHPEDPRVVYLGAQLDLIDSNVGSAIRHLEKLAAASTPSVLTRGTYLLAQAQIYGGRLQAALSTLDSGIAEDQRQGDTLAEFRKRLARAQVHALLGNPQASPVEWGGSSAGTQDVDALAAFGCVLARTGRLAEANGILAQIERSPGGHQHQENLRGEVALASGRSGDAIRAFSAAKRIRLGHPPSEALARAFAQARRFEEAAKEYRELSDRKAEVIYPADSPWFSGVWVRALYDAGRCSLEMGNKPEARQYLRNYLWALDGADPTIPTVQEARQLLRGK